MADALEADDPVGQVLRAELPSFLAWFTTWRDMRNEVKQGRDFVIAGSGDEVGIAFVAFRESNDKIMIAGSDQYLHLIDVTQALMHGRAVAELIHRWWH